MDGWGERALRGKEGKRKRERETDRDNILQEKARPWRELADEYLLESTKD